MDITEPKLPDPEPGLLTNDERLAGLQNRTYTFFETVLDEAMSLFVNMSTQEKIKFCQSSLPALAKMMTISESDEIQSMREIVGELQREMRERLIA